MNPLSRLAVARAARKRPNQKGSKLTPMGSLALARGSRTGNGGLAALGTLLLILGRARRRSKRGRIIHRTRLRPGKALKIAVTREGDVIDVG